MASIDSIKKSIENDCSKAVSSTINELKSKLVGFVASEFYSQYFPFVYVRTYQLLNEAPQCAMNSSLEGRVFMEGGGLQYNGISGDSVIGMSAGGIHGNASIQTPGRYWESFINFCDSEAVNMLIKHLK